MKKFLPLAALALVLAACSSEQKATDLPPGKYENKTSATDANGTTTTQTKTTDVSVDANGKKKAVVKKKKTTDPRGLMNKTTTESEQTIQQK